MDYKQKYAQLLEDDYFDAETKQELKKYIYENDLDLDIEVDGGINNITASNVVEAGANILVAGNYILSHENPKEAIEILKNA